MILNSLIDWYFVNNFYSIGLYDVISVTYERFLKFSLLNLNMPTNEYKLFKSSTFDSSFHIIFWREDQPISYKQILDT